jgi:flavin-dependent dehydrogenase
MSPQPEAEVLIAGGGLAGSAAAIQLARAGRRVVSLERSTAAHDKVCGEFLSAEALGYLAGLGVDLAALGAVPIRAVRLAGVTRALPFRAMSLTRCRLDEELLRLAAAAGATVRRGCRVQALTPCGTVWRAQLENDVVEARAAFLATGKHDVAGHPRPPGKQPNLVGFKMYFRLAESQSAVLQECVELSLYRGGYAGLQPVEGGAANLCCLIDRAVLRRLGGGWANLLAAMQQQCPELRERLTGARPLLEKPLAIAAIPYGYVRAGAAADGLWLLGDQAAVIPSFTGDGMSIALHSGCLAAAMYLEGAASSLYHQQLHEELSRQVALATTLSRALVWPGTQRLMASAAALWPGLIETLAQRTRIAHPVLDRASRPA